MLLVLSLTFLMLTPFAVASNEQGFTVTSVSLSNILHPGQSASQTQWLITVVLNGGGQGLVGNLGNSTVNYQGFTSLYPLQISGSTNPEKASYQIYNTAPTPIYKFSALAENGTLGLIFGQIDSHTNAPFCPLSYAGGTLFGEKDVNIENLLSGAVPTISRTCIYQQIVGYEAGIGSTPNIQSSSTLYLTANGKTEALNISYNQQSATSTDGLVQANWVGSLVTGNAAPSANIYVAINNPKQNQWNVQTESTYNTYVSSYSTAQSQLSSTAMISLQALPQPCSSLEQNLTSQSPVQISQCMLNNFVMPKFATDNQESETLLSTSVKIGNNQAQFSQNNGQSSFVTTLNNTFVNNQQIVLRINGSFIGVVVPEGTPKIISASASPFNSGNNGTIVVSVENIGTAQGTFYTSLTSCAGITTASSNKYSVNPGQSQQIYIQIYTSNATQVINEMCNVTVTDYNGGGSSSTLVNVRSKPANECQPGVSTVEGDYICPCINTNGVYTTGTGSQCTNCQYGVIQNNGVYTCANAPQHNRITNSSSTAALPQLNNQSVSEGTKIVKAVVCGNKNIITAGIASVVASTGIGAFISGLIDVGAKALITYGCTG